jgi:hypothetical protein
MTSCEHCGTTVEQPIAPNPDQGRQEQAYCSAACRRSALSTEAMEKHDDPFAY